jgi:putative transposase
MIRSRHQSYQSSFSTDSFYHIINRGIANQKLFNDASDYQRFIVTLNFYIEKNPPQKLSLTTKEELNKILLSSPKKPLVEIISYCLMPNHFHLLLKQLEENGITNFMKNLQNSYTRYYNSKNKRIGTMYQGTFKAVTIENDEQLLHVSRYIHLNPFASKITNHHHQYPWSSYKIYLDNRTGRICSPKLILEMIGSPSKFQKFIDDYADYARTLAVIKNQILE